MAVKSRARAGLRSLATVGCELHLKGSAEARRITSVPTCQKATLGKTVWMVWTMMRKSLRFIS